MKIKYELNGHEIRSMRLSIMLMNNRLSRPYYAGEFGGFVTEDLYKKRHCRRYDMFWISLHVKDKHLGYVYVDPKPGILQGPVDRFWLDDKDTKLTYKTWLRIEKKVRAFFEQSSEYQQQIEWVKRIKILIEWDKRELEEY